MTSFDEKNETLHFNKLFLTPPVLEWLFPV